MTPYNHLTELLDEAAVTIRKDRHQYGVKMFLVGWLSGILFMSLLNALL